MKQKLLHIMMGTHNPDLQKGLDSVFQCIHFDWTIYGENKHQLNIDLLNTYHSFQPDIVFIHTQCDAINKETLQKMKH